MNTEQLKRDPMKETEQTLLDQIKDQVAREKGYDDWETMENWFIDHNFPSNVAVLLTGSWKIVCERFATAKAKASCEATLKNASENARTKSERVPTSSSPPECQSYKYEKVIDKSSITDPSNIVIVL